jgi:two-component system sensor histidine kinase KdpD
LTEGENDRMAGTRGHYKIFLGMAPGVGKTYRMLQEGQAEAAAGRDVVIGYLESHGRAETAAQADGLESVPRRPVSYRDTAMEEMDLPAVLERAPELALIDELAHSNAPGLEHEKRYQDIRDVLAAQIDVFSTVNVQHLESLNDQVTELTGVRVRETFPDEVLGEADEVILIDLTPEALIQRLREGRVYPGRSIDSALNNFFRIENLAALRELALRQVAENVESRRLSVEVVGRPGEDRLVNAATQAVSEHLMVLIEPKPREQKVLRRAWRSAQRLSAPLDVLIVRPPGDLKLEEKQQIDAIRRLSSLLGAHLIVEEGDDVAETAARVARERGTTYILMGVPKFRGGLGRFGEGLPSKILRRLPGVDLRVIGDRAELSEEEAEW